MFRYRHNRKKNAIFAALAVDTTAARTAVLTVGLSFPLVLSLSVTYPLFGYRCTAVRTIHTYPVPVYMVGVWLLSNGHFSIDERDMVPNASTWRRAVL